MKIGRNDPCPCGSGKKYKKCCLIKMGQNIHGTLEKFFDREWIESELGKTKMDGYKDINPMNLARLDFHPLIRAIIGTQFKLETARANGKTPIALGKDELLQKLLHENLVILEPLLDVSDLRKRLQNKIEFPKAEYELAIAAGYRRMGDCVSFISRTSKRTGEFYIADKSGDAVLVECKKKDIISPKEENLKFWWEEFQHLMTKCLKSYGNFYGIALCIPFSPQREEIKGLTNEIKKLITSGFIGEVRLLNDKYKLYIEKFSSPRQCEIFARNSDSGVINKLVDRKTGEISRLIKIVGYLPSDFIDEKVESTVRTLGDAYGQLEDDKPNILYIDINVAAMTLERLKKILAKLPSAIEKKLNQDYSKISAVVLTNLKLLSHSDIMGFRADEYVIYNKKAAKPLPKGFQIYGDRINGQSILKDIGDLVGKDGAQTLSKI